MDADPLLALATGIDNEVEEQPADPIKQLAEEADKDISHRPYLPALRPPTQPGGIPISNSSLTAQQAEAAAKERLHHIGAFQRTASQQHRSASAPRTFKDVGQGSLIERHSGLKVKNPLVSSSQMESRLANVNAIRLAQLRSRHQTAGLGSSWCTLGALGERSAPRESAAGNTYSVWKLTDLDSTVVSLFLFGRAHAELRREAEGSLVAVFGAKVRAGGGEFSLSVDSGEQVLVLGRAAEFGYCKATKKNGEPCRVPINAARCPFCPYHVTSEFNRLQPRRIELQGGQLKSAYRPGMQSGLKWEPGQFRSADAAARPRMPAASQDQLRSAADQAAGRGSAAGSRYVRTVADPGAAKAAAAEVEVAKLRRNKLSKDAAPIPMARSSKVVVQLAEHGRAAVVGGKRKAAAAAGGGSAAAGGQAGKRRVLTSPADGGASMVLLEDDDIFEAAGAGPSSNGTSDAARQRAIEILRASEGAQRPAPAAAVPAFLAAPLHHMQEQQYAAAAATAAAGDLAGVEAAAAAPRAPPLPAPQPRQQQPGRPQPRPSAAATAAAQRSIAAKAGAALALRPRNAPKTKPPTQQLSSKPSSGKPASGFAAAFGSVIQEMQAKAELQAKAGGGASGSGSIYRDLVDDEDEERLGRVLDALGKKDEMAERMDSIKQLEVSVWRCNVCEYTAEHRRPECAAGHAHATHKIRATKRWWECGNGACRRRFTTVGVRYPPGRCTKCDLPGVEFKAVSMLRPQRESAHEREQGVIASRDKLLARGTEQKWVMG